MYILKSVEMALLLFSYYVLIANGGCLLPLLADNTAVHCHICMVFHLRFVLECSLSRWAANFRSIKPPIFFEFTFIFIQQRCEDVICVKRCSCVTSTTATPIGSLEQMVKSRALNWWARLLADLQVPRCDSVAYYHPWLGANIFADASVALHVLLMCKQ